MDGADAFLLGAETLRGTHPVLTVSTILSIARQAEAVFDHTHHFDHLMAVRAAAAYFVRTIVCTRVPTESLRLVTGGGGVRQHPPLGPPHGRCGSAVFVVWAATKGLRCSGKARQAEAVSHHTHHFDHLMLVCALFRLLCIPM